MSVIYDMTDTWNNVAVTYNAIKMNVTDTASAADSLLAALQVGGVSQAKISKGGLLTLTGGVVATSGAFSGQLSGGGTTTNDSAAAGKIGEYVSSSVASGSAVSLVSATANDVTSISLTAGDWDVEGQVTFLLNAATTMTIIAGWVSTTAITQPALPNSGAMFLEQLTFATGAGQGRPTGCTRISVGSTTTVYLGARATFAVNTCAAYGFIGARRVR